jgi:hypothetical protein
MSPPTSPPSWRRRRKDWTAAYLVLLCHYYSFGGGRGGNNNNNVGGGGASSFVVAAFSPVLAPPAGIPGRRAKTTTTTTRRTTTGPGRPYRAVDRRFGEGADHPPPSLRFRMGGRTALPSSSPPRGRSSSSSTLRGSNNNDGDGDGDPPLRRFLDPVIDDPGLPLTDALVAQVVGPALQVFWLALNSAPSPTWLIPVGRYLGEAPGSAPRGSLLAPALIHGAGLAVCWGLGALAARLYEREAFALSPPPPPPSKEEEEKGGRTGTSSSSSSPFLGGYAHVLAGLVRAGAFAAGVLVLSTQFDLLLEFRGRYVMLGESDETDFRLLVAYVEIINDVFWEGLVLSTWRIVHAGYMNDDGNRRRRF